MSKQYWTPSKIMQAHLQSLVCQGIMMAVELMTCRVPEDPASLTPVEGNIVAFTMFYERGFGVPSHRFFRSLLQYYGLELHNLTPLRILRITTFHHTM
jgi:hypothetical protein